MDKNDFSNLGDDIKKTVKSSIDSMDFEGLRKDVLKSVNSIVGDVQDILKESKNMNRNQSSVRRENDRREYRYRYENKRNSKYYSDFEGRSPIDTGDSSEQSSQYYTNTNKNQYNNTKNSQTNYKYNSYQEYTPIAYQVKEPAYVEQYKREGLVTRNPIGRISGILYIVFGSISSGIFGLLFLIFALVATDDVVPVTAVVMMLLCTLVSAMMIANGVRLRKRVQRFKDYVFQLKGRKYCDISELSEKVGASNKYVIHDIKRMMRLRMFREAHIDRQGTCFILDDETYNQYKALENREYEQIQHNDTQASEEIKDDIKTNQSTELERTIEEGKGFIDEVNLMNQAIKGEEISNKLYRLENIIKKIFDYVEQHPEQIAEIHRFMDYYFPMTLKLVHAYKELDEQPVQGENISNTKKEIENTLDTINSAFEKFLDSLFQDMALDISSDISVLNTMLAQEGLSKKDFD